MKINNDIQLFIPKLHPIIGNSKFNDVSNDLKSCTILALSTNKILDFIKHLQKEDCLTSVIIDTTIYNINNDIIEHINLLNVKIYLYEKENLSQLKIILNKLQESNFYIHIDGNEFIQQSLKIVINELTYFIFDLLKTFISLQYNSDQINIFLPLIITDEIEKTYINGILNGYYGLAKSLNIEQRKIKLIPFKVKKSNTKNIINYIKNKLKIKETQYNFDEYLIEGNIYEKKWVSTIKADDWKSKFKNNSTIWIAGGLGGVGIKITKYILNTYQNLNIIITGRTIINTQISEKLISLSQNGSQLDYYSVDVCNSNELEIFIKKLENKNCILNGVIYCAGVNHDSLLNFKTKEQIEKVISPKIIGLLNVDNSTVNYPLDFFISLSSIVSIIGNIGQTDYAYANAFIDTFPEYRRKLNRPGISLTVNLGLIDTGMGNDKKVIERFRKRNIYPLDSTIVPYFIHQALSIGGEIAITTPNEFFKIDSNTNIINYMKTSNFSLENNSPKEIIKKCLSHELELPISSLDEDSDFSSFGIDSIMIMNMVEYLSNYCTEPIDHSLLIENSTINELSKAISPYLKSSINEPINEIEDNPIYSDNNEKKQDSNVNYIHSNKVSTNDFAIIGMACKFPDADNVQEFYDNLKKGKFSIKEFPKERINSQNYDDFYNKNKVYVNQAGTINYTKFLKKEYLDNGEDLDWVDPQQLVFIDTIHDLLEDMNYTKEDIKGKKISVFVGGHELDYYKKKDIKNKFSGKHGITNVISNMVPARISHYFDLKGTSEMIYTACSSSLVALKNACNSLLMGDSEMAIVGGIELLIDEQWFIGFCESKVLAQDGKCKAFDYEADGFVLGEGVGAITIKKYNEALKDGDNIWAVIKGISINNDGHTLGLTTPNRFIQEELIQDALYKSNIDPSTIGCYEAHGTATQLGDPIEIKAASNVYKKYSSNIGYCGLGSLKTNIGHLLSAAGIASVIKMILSIKYGYLFPTLNCKNLNPKLDIDSSPFFIIEECQPWKVEHPRRGAISSFGFGGTNCHMIIEEFFPPETYKKISNENKKVVNAINYPNDENLEKLLLYLVENKINKETFINSIKNG